MDVLVDGARIVGTALGLIAAFGFTVVGVFFLVVMVPYYVWCWLRDLTRWFRDVASQSGQSSRSTRSGFFDGGAGSASGGDC